VKDGNNSSAQGKTASDTDRQFGSLANPTQSMTKIGVHAYTSPENTIELLTHHCPHAVAVRDKQGNTYNFGFSRFLCDFRLPGMKHEVWERVF